MKFRETVKRYKKLRCKCGRRVRITNPYYKVDTSGKSHAHCICGLEWHWTLEGKIYCHKRKYEKT